MCTAGSSEPELIDEGIRARCVCDDRLRETDTLIVYLKISISLAYGLPRSFIQRLRGSYCHQPL